MTGAGSSSTTGTTIGSHDHASTFVLQNGAKTDVAARALPSMFTPMKVIKYCVHKEPPYYVAQCLNVDVSSFGETAELAVANLKEAVELYFD
jgi:hypothetical protein